MKNRNSKNNKTMKTQITKIAAAFMLLAAGTSLNANTGEAEKSVKVSTENSKAVVLQLNNLSEGTEISLIDQKGIVLFQDEAEQAKYAKVFNLTTLQEGEIYLEIENDEQLEVLTIKVTDTEAYLAKSAEVMIEKPILKMNGETAKVFFGQNEGMTKVTLFDGNHDIAYRDNAASGSARSYDLSDLPAGSYTFQFKTGDRTFYQGVTVK